MNILVWPTVLTGVSDLGALLSLTRQSHSQFISVSIGNNFLKSIVYLRELKMMSLMTRTNTVTTIDAQTFSNLHPSLPLEDEGVGGWMSIPELDLRLFT